MTSNKTQSKQPVADLIAEECLAVRVRLLNRTITGIYDDALRPLGMTVGQLNILVAVCKLGPISPRDLARRLNMEKSTLSRNIRLMEEDGLVQTRPGASLKLQEIRLTRKGQGGLKAAFPAWERAQEEAKETLGDATIRALLGQRSTD